MRALMIALLLLTPTLFAVCGDCTGDGEVTILDALIVAQVDAGIVPVSFALSACDVASPIQPDCSNDPFLSIVDAMILAQASCGQVVALPCICP